MATNNSSNNQFTNNADGFDLSGGTTKRKLTLTAGDLTLSSGGSNTYTFPSATDTLVGRTSTDTLTNKTMTSATNSVGPAARTGGFYIGVITAATFGSTGNKSITGVGFTPKLVRFYPLPSTATTINAGFGAMTTSSQFSVAWSYSGSPSRYSTTSFSITVLSSGSTTIIQQASYVSMDSDGFTINVGTASSTFDVAFECYA